MLTYSKRYLRSGLLGLLLATAGFLSPAAPPKAKATVYVFLAETCPISQNSTLLLRQLDALYGNQGVRLVGIFPDDQATPASLAAFAQTYRLGFPLQPDADRQLARRLHATITPEVVVLAPDNHTVLYQGRLDDSYVGLGQRRALTQHHELADALAAIVAGRPVAVGRTEAVGCFIEGL